jgi:membrane-associated protease RseP (regulator of RpoE activity)
MGAELQPFPAVKGASSESRKGGVWLVSVPPGSEAVAVGLQEKDLIRAVNGTPVVTVDACIKRLSEAGAGPLTLSILRQQQAMEITVQPSSYVEIETSNSDRDFTRLALPSAPAGTLVANQKTSNDPLRTLSDCRLAKGFGPIYSNGVKDGAYKMDLGSVQPVAAVTSWSYAHNVRGRQKVMIYGSAAETDPGWNLSRFTPLGALDTGDLTGPVFTAASLRAVEGRTLGNYRWILWAVSPVTKTAGGENTAFQELHVERGR